jgi:hypothetical protein
MQTVIALYFTGRRKNKSIYIACEKYTMFSVEKNEIKKGGKSKASGHFKIIPL